MDNVRTIDASIVRLNSNLCDLAILCQEGISLTSVVSEDCRAIEQKIQSRVKGGTWVAKEANLAQILASYLHDQFNTTLANGIRLAKHPDVRPKE